MMSYYNIDFKKIRMLVKYLSVILYRQGSLQTASALLSSVRYESRSHLIKSSHICGHDGLLCTCLSIFLSVCLSVSQQPPLAKRLTLEEGGEVCARNGVWLNFTVSLLRCRNVWCNSGVNEDKRLSKKISLPATACTVSVCLCLTFGSTCYFTLIKPEEGTN